MRQRYVVTYDIADPRRLRRVFKLLKGFGTHLQLSVFACDLTELTLVQLKASLSSAIHATDDAVLFIDIGPSEGRGMESFECIGRATAPPPRGPRIV